MSRSRIILFCEAGVLVLLALVAVGSRLQAALIKNGLSHDESISYLAASCHEGAYEDILRGHQPPYGVWSKASAWQRLVDVDQRFCFATIARDLARFDIHPPLFFWLLHLATLALHPGAAAGLLLNAMLDGLSCFFLVLLGRGLGWSRRVTAGVALLWLASPGVVLTASEIRQYSLVGLGCITLALALARLEQPRAGARLAAAVAICLLAHYQCVLYVAGATAIAAARLARGGIRRLMAPVAAAGAGAAVAVALFPDVLLYVGEGHSPLGRLTFMGMGERFQRCLDGLSFFALPGTPAGAAAVVAAWSAWALASVIAWRRGRLPWASATVGALGTWIGVSTLGFFLLGVAPPHAMGGRYLAPLWPFVAMAPALTIPTLPRLGRAIHTALALAVACGAMMSWQGSGSATRKRADLRASLAQAGRVVFANTARGVLLPEVLLVPPETAVLAAPARELIASPAWLEPLDASTVVVERPIFAVSGADVRQLSAIVRARAPRAKQIVGGTDLAIFDEEP